MLAAGWELSAFHFPHSITCDLAVPTGSHSDLCTTFFPQGNTVSAKKSQVRLEDQLW
jgi:hypothetical protein